MSVVCAEFGCTPTEALGQPWSLVEAVLDYRTAERAKELFNAKDKKVAFEELSAKPYLLEVLAMMTRAQRGMPLEGPHLRREGLAVAEANRKEDEPSPP